MPLEKLYHFAAFTGTPLEGLLQPAHAPTHIVKQSSIHASVKWQDGGRPVSKCTGLCKFSLYLECTALQWIPVLLLTHVSNSKSVCACLWYEHHYSFCVCWQVTWPNDLRTRFCQHWDTTGQTTLEDHWSHKYTVMPLEPHWLMLSSSGVPVMIQC